MSYFAQIYREKQFLLTVVLMGLADLLSDIFAAVSIQNVDAESPQPSGELNDDKDQGTGRSTCIEQTGGAATRGGTSTSTPVTGSNEELEEESEVNKKDEVKSTGSEGSSNQETHIPSSVKEGKAKDEETGSPIKEKGDEDGDNDRAVGEEDEDEDEDENEPVDPKPIIEEGKAALLLKDKTPYLPHLIAFCCVQTFCTGQLELKPVIECANSKECLHHKNHYEACVDRVTQQVEDSGKSKEDCVEECKFYSIGSGFLTKYANNELD